MTQYTLFTDFATLDKKTAGNWVANCSQLADVAFKDSCDEVRILGNLLVLEQYFHTFEQGMKETGQKPAEIMYEAIQILWDYLYEKIIPSDFEDFANNVYACVLEYMVGEELTDKQFAFYNSHFLNNNACCFQWDILSWVSYLLLELIAIHGGRLDFDEFEEYDRIDFVQIDEMLNALNDACIEFAGVDCPSSMARDVIKAMEEVYATPLFQSIISKVQKSLQDALHAKPEDYKRLKEEYSKTSILPEEFAAAFSKF